MGQLIDMEQNPMNAAIADALAQQQAVPSHSLDQLADATLERIAEFFGECVNAPDFCGFAVDEVRDENKVLLSLTLVACDTVSGEAVRRVKR